MTVRFESQIPPAEETRLIEHAQRGDSKAFGALVEPWRRPLFGFVYRMVAHPADAEDLTQEVLTRALEALSKYKGEAPFKSWLFGIASHVCLDHLRAKSRWRFDAQLLSEQEADSNAEKLDRVLGLMAQPDFRYEVREHVAFCFTCVGRSLDPEEQAALVLREVMGFSAREAAEAMKVSESVFRHRLSSARKTMIGAFDGLCQLINKSGACHQCSGLREAAPEANRGSSLTQITVRPGVAVTADSLLDARLSIVKDADLEEGTARTLHEMFFTGLTLQEEAS